VHTMFYGIPYYLHGVHETKNILEVYIKVKFLLVRL
jgi:hypothetical protein